MDRRIHFLDALFVISVFALIAVLVIAFAR